MALLNFKKHQLFIAAAIATILVAIAIDYMVPDTEIFARESLISSDKTTSPSTFTDYKLSANEFTHEQRVSMPIPVEGAGNVWSNYNRNDFGIFTYSPFEPQNEQNEDVLHYGDDHRQAELRAIFQKKYCFNGQLKFIDQASSDKITRGPSPSSSPSAPVDAIDASILGKLTFPKDRRKCNPCSEKCEFTMMDSDRRLDTEEFLVRPRGTDTEEIYARLEQVWTRVFHGVREIIL